MVWLLSKHDEATISEIEKHSDRSAAILATSCLEERLTELLQCALDECPDVSNRMLKGYGPLATFRAKIDIALTIGLCDQKQHKNLNYIREIRNEFAHSAKPTTFKTQRIGDLCSNLFPQPKFSGRKLKSYRNKITPQVIDELIKERNERGVATYAFLLGSQGRLVTNRSRFMFSVKYNLFIFHILDKLTKTARERSELDPATFHYWPWSSSRRADAQAPPRPQSEDQKPKKRQPPPRSSGA